MCTCQHCQKPFETKSPKAKFCSVYCKSSWHHNEKRSSRLKLAACHYCAGAIDTLNLMNPSGTRRSKTFKFCCEDHKKKYHHRKANNKPVPLQVSPKLLIWCKKYDEIPSIIAKYRANAADLTGGLSKFVIPHDPSKNKGKRIKTKHDDYVFG